MKLYFTINYGTEFGKKVVLKVQDGKNIQSYDLQFSDNRNWKTEIDFFSKSIEYKYLVVDENNQVIDEEICTHHLNFVNNFSEYNIYDVWNNKNFPENYLNNKILQNKLGDFKAEKVSILKKHTHHFRIEAPLYSPDWRLVIAGNNEALGSWDFENAEKMAQTSVGVWEVAVDLKKQKEFVQYKYAILDKKHEKIIAVEYGENRLAFPNQDDEVLQVHADHFFRFSAEQLYKAAGVAVPVFSLRSDDGFGVGEFSDLKKLADWAHKTNLSVIQILPINDTTANYTWTDSYPYAAISVYALHPQYLSLEKIQFGIPEAFQMEFKMKRDELNALSLVDYEQMISEKWKFIKVVFEENKTEILKDKDFSKFLKENADWLKPYAAFCVLRDKNNTPNFNNWKTHKKYVAGKIAQLFDAKHADFESVMLHAWVQYQLHLQLKEAVDYTHGLGISLKGDLPIGIYRYSVEAWTEPELFGMDFQAGAPPDEFSDLGQNWEFPTYNWEVMQANNYDWWKKRFAVIARYFDAMRIDHILGFFRIWRMPMTATQGLLGYFYPAVPITIEEFAARHIPFNFDRYCKPFINDQILWDIFGNEKDAIAEHFMYQENGVYHFKQEYDCQRKLAEYFKKNPRKNAEEKLISLAANVLFLQEFNGTDYVYHPRFNINKTISYQYLSDWEKKQLYDLYVDYFFRRQDGLWYQKAMEKLPMLLAATDMLICGEDLGLVPDCVPVVMDKLGITALKVQRSPKEDVPYYDPQSASYMNVVTASSHDSSTLRQWWKENRELTQHYFNNQLKQFGTAPSELLPELAEIIMKQHLHSEAMLAIFPIQEYFATDYEIVNPYADDERINNPANFPHYWRYRMHISIEELLQKEYFNNKIAHFVAESGRN
ncbi:4-alpha-glucanotransferase [Cloacibacterium sp.]|uniref:4-alpha-glucanotransferase n=1 Tax=Cloacibacterium sp. TaxID=1913682 RepID=UPI0035B4C8A7